MYRDARTAATLHPVLMVDHPGWLTSPSGSIRRSFRSGDTTWTIVYEPHNNGSAPRITMETPNEAPADELHLKQASYDPAALPPMLQNVHPFRSAVPMYRIPNPDLWDALLYPILRHRVREIDATAKYRKLCETHGTGIDTTAGPTHLVPRPETLITLTDDELTAVGMRGRLDRLRTAAHAYLTHADSWQKLSPVELFADLQTVRHIGRWSAGAIVADVTNDFSYYSFFGEPVHTRWRELFLSLNTDLPEHRFKDIWTNLDRNQLSTLVALLLASKRRSTDGRGPRAVKPTACEG